MITEIEQQTSDIDWFFVAEETIAFVASGGGRLPESVAKSNEQNELLSTFFRSLPETSEVIINPDLSKIVTKSIDDQYLSDFIFMAKRGLFSFDKTVLNNFSNLHYHLVAEPVNPLTFYQLPIEIREIIIESKFNGNMELTIDVNLIA